MSSKLKVEFIDNSASQYDENADRIKVSSKNQNKLGKLFIGDRYSASFLQLKSRNVKSVVNCCKEIHGLSQETDVRYLKIDPEEDDDNVFEASYEFIDTELEKGKNVVVHCESGLNQSASVIVYYLMKRGKLSLAESYKSVKAQRKKEIKIRPILLQKLIRAEKALRGTISIMLDGRKVVFLDGIGSAKQSKNSVVVYYVLFAVVAFFAVLFLGIYLATGKI